MSEENQEATAPEAEATKIENAPVPEVEAPAVETPSQEEASEPTEEPKLEPKKSRAKERIEELVSKNHDLKKEAEQLKAELEALKSVKKPEADAYEDDTDYDIDRSLYIKANVERKEKEAKLENLKRQEQELSQSQLQEAFVSYNESLQKAPAEVRAFIQQNDSKFKARSAEINTEIMASPYGVEVYEVILRDVEKFNAMSDTKFLKEVAKIEAKFENAMKPIKPPVSVPNPPASLSSGGGLSNGNEEKSQYGASYAQMRKSIFR